VPLYSRYSAQQIPYLDSLHSIKKMISKITNNFGDVCTTQFIMLVAAIMAYSVSASSQGHFHRKNLGAIGVPNLRSPFLSVITCSAMR
jgi:hypothetical protein